MLQVKSFSRCNLRTRLVDLFFLIMMGGSVLVFVSLVFSHMHLLGGIDHFFKLVYLAELALAGYFVVRNCFSKDYFLLILAIMGFVGGINGLLSHGINKYTWSHAYGAFMPIFSMIFGNYLVKVEGIWQGKKLEKLIRWCTVLMGISIITYFILYKLGFVGYFGVSSNLFFYTPFFLAEGAIFWFLACIALALFTGKRSTLVAILLQVVLYVFFVKKKRVETNRLRFGQYLPKIFLIVMMVGVLFGAYKLNMLKRFEQVFSAKLGDEYSLYVATGGRIFEVQYALKHLNKEPRKWLTGGGWGENFFIQNGLFRTDGYILHYTHFSPGYVILVYGLPFALIYYLFLINTFMQSLRFAANPLVLIFITMFALSFAGSVLFVDVFFWVSFGATREILRRTRQGSRVAAKQDEDAVMKVALV